MPHETLEDRVARLETIVEQMKNGSADQSAPRIKDWRRTVGMFRGDSVMKEVIDGALQMREEERRQFHENEETESS